MSKEAMITIGDVLSELHVDLPAGGEAAANEQQMPAETTATAGAAGETEERAEGGDAGSEAGPEAGSEDGAETDEGAADDDEGGDEPEDDEGPEEAKEARAVRKLTKRVDKLTARAKTAEEEAETLRTKLAEREQQLERAQPIVLQDQADVLGDVTTVEELEARVASASTVIDHVPELIARADAEGEVAVQMGDGSVRTFSKAELMERLQRAKAIVKGEANKRSWLAQREPSVAEARTEYPELFQEDHPARKLMLQTLKMYPGLAKMPNMELALGDMMNGYLMRLERQKRAAEGGEPKAKAAAAPATAKAAAAKPKVAPKMPSPAATPKAAAAAGATKPSREQALRALRENGSASAAEDFVGQLLG